MKQTTKGYKDMCVCVFKFYSLFPYSQTVFPYTQIILIKIEFYYRLEQTRSQNGLFLILRLHKSNLWFCEIVARLPYLNIKSYVFICMIKMSKRNSIEYQNVSFNKVNMM